MKQLTDLDIEKMADGAFVPDFKRVNRDVRAHLRLGRLIPPDAAPVPQVCFAWTCIKKQSSRPGTP